MELVTIFRDPLFRDDGRGSGVVKLRLNCPRGVADADAVAGAGVEPRGGDAGFCSCGFADAVVDACRARRRWCAVSRPTLSRFAARTGGGRFLGWELPLLLPFTGEEKGSSSVVTLEDFSMASLGCNDWTECVDDSSMVVEPSKSRH